MTTNSITRYVHGLTAVATAIVLSGVVAACGSSTPRHTQSTLAAQAPALTTSTVSATSRKRHVKRRSHHRSASDRSSDSRRKAATTTSTVALKPPKKTTTHQAVHRPAKTSTTPKIVDPPAKTSTTPKVVPTTPTKTSTSPSKKPPTVTTIAGTSASPVYSGPDPLYCLQKVGLNDVRTGQEPGVWEGNFANTSPDKTNEIVFVAGPYATDDEATKYAASLETVPELAAAGGRWVASAAATSHLSFQVKVAAECMAGPA